MNTFETLTMLDQQHLMQYWHFLDTAQKTHLAQQIADLDVDTITMMRRQLKERAPAVGPYDPFLDYAKAGNPDDVKKGFDMISQGLMGCLIVAGGQGSRLRFDGPKGMFPISVVEHKSLFQLFAEKTLAAGKQAGRELLIAIMTSPQNHAETMAFFESHSFFGLSPRQVSFFSQGTLPLLDVHGNMFLESRDTIAEGPDGNGSSLQHFFESGIWDKWHAQGVRYLNYVLVDNVLADPFDPELLGFHARREGDITLKCTAKRHPEEKLGVLVKQGGSVRVIEYSELPDSESRAMRDGVLKHVCANLSLFCCSMDFIKNRVVPECGKMPLHLAFKAAKHLDENGNTVAAHEPMAWKFERFIFDILPLASHVYALLYPRNRCFAAVKNFSGDESPGTAQAALQQQDGEILSQITGTEPPEHPFELAQEFHYPTPELLKAWRGKVLASGGYIEP